MQKTLIDIDGKRTVKPGDVLENTAVKPGFEIVRF
jgi:hypothetical protein